MDKLAKSDFLLQKAKELIARSSEYEVDLVLCGGVSIHILSDFLHRESSRPWNHKDIDFVVPLSQFGKAIIFFKDLGYAKVFTPYKKAHLIRNHTRFGTKVDNAKILVDIYGLHQVPIIRVTNGDLEIPLISPRIELDNWIDRKKRLGGGPSVDLSIEFLRSVTERNFAEQILS
jgi:hypothetical protein